MKTLPISEVRANLPKLVDDVDKTFDRIALTRSGRTKAVLMSSEEFDAWNETIEVLSNTKTMQALQQAQEEAARGEVLPHDELLKEIASS